MMMVIIYGGITVMEDRKKGVLSRMLFSPLSKGEVFQAKLLGRWLMGVVQALILFVVGKIFFKLDLGSVPLALLVIAVFALAMAALSVFIGSLCRKEDLIIGLAVLLANIFAGLGGCWWPSEIVPPGVRPATMISPAYWAMDALHKLRFFQGGFGDIRRTWGSCWPCRSSWRRRRAGLQDQGLNLDHSRAEAAQNCRVPVSGRTTRKVVPLSGSLSTSIPPPCILATDSAMDRPRPVPPSEAVRALSTR